MELWLWLHSYITNQNAVTQSEARIDEAAADGYTGIVFWDSSFSFMAAPFWSDSNVSYLQQVMNYAEAKGLKVTATVAPYGASQDALQNNPNWAESQRVVGTQFQVSSDGKSLQLISDFAGLQNPGFEGGQTAWFGLNDVGVSLDCTTSHTGSCAALIQNAPGNARVVQSLAVHPWRQYHIRFWYKSQACGGCNPNIYVYDAANMNIVRYNTSFNANGGQDWTQVDYTINSQASSELLLYLGVWGGNTGSLWFDDISIEETDLIFLTRRSGTPIKMYDPQNPNTVYQEGTDFNYIADPSMVNWRTPFTNLWHTPPIITLPSTTTLKPGQIVALDSYAVTMMPNELVGMCLTEQGTLDWQKSNAQAINAMMPADAGIMMQYDEMRQMDSCASCRAKGLTPGQLLAWHVQQSTNLYQSLHTGGPLYVWSDMFDPYHNATDNYYYVEGDISGSWQGLASNVIVMNWNLGSLTNSLTWFSGLNASQPTPHQQIIAGYYDQGNGTWSAQDELGKAAGIPGIKGLMYTTWGDDYSQIAQYAAAAKAAWPYYIASLASSKGNIAGTVNDASGTPIPGATVTVSEGSLTWSTTTNGAGNYSFSNLPSGSYSLQISSYGYNSYSNSTVQVPTLASGASASTNTVNLPASLSQPASFASIRIKGGGSSMTDEQGNQWLADTGYDAGGSAAPLGAAVSNTPTPSLYASQHYNNGDFTYNVSVPNGNYYLTLKFAELYDNGPKQRLFNILVNGQMVDQNVDVYTLAGGLNQAYDLKLPVVVTGHWITVKFQAVADNPIVNAIQIDAADSSFVLPGNITGQVLNYEGQTVPDATVTLSNAGTRLTSTTDNSGNYSFWNLPAGTYTLQASGLGYNAATAVTIPVTAGNTANTNLTLTQPPTPLPIRIKCGGGSLTDEAGNIWMSDLGFYDYGSTGVTGSSMANTNTPSVYQSQRWMSGPMVYKIPVPNGTYNLVLKFSEWYWSAPNQRVFNVVVNGVTVQQNVDIVGAVGPLSAYDVTVPVSVTNQWVTIEFDPVVNNPSIDAIELDPVQVGPSTVTGTILNNAQQGIPGAVVWLTNHSYRRSVTSDASGNYAINNLPSGTYTLQVSAPGYIPYTSWAVTVNPAVSTTVNVPLMAEDPSFTPLRVNAGGWTLVDESGENWVADGYYSAGAVGKGDKDISNVANPEIYRWQRWMSGDLNYNFNLPNGNYMVILKFAETYFSSPGQRVFNVVLNGTTVMPKLDPFKAAGGANLGYDLEAPVTITNNSLNVKLQQVIQNPSLAGIDIEAILPEPIAAVSPQALAFGSQQQGVAGTAQSVTVSNPGNAPLTFSSVAITGANTADFALQNGCGTTLAANAQCTLQVTFQPTATGIRSATLLLQTNAGPQAVALSGTGFGSPQAVLSATSLDFGSINLNMASTAQSLTLSNAQGTAALTISSVALSGANAGDFAVRNSCGSTIAAGASCSLSIQFQPSALGPRQATLVLNDNASASSQIVVLTGNGGTPTQALELFSKSSYKAVDLSAFSMQDGGSIEQWDYWGGANQKWFVIPVGNGYYQIQSSLSQKALEVANASLANGALIQQRTYSGAANQQWLFTPLGNGYYKITNKLSGKALDLPAFSTANGTQLDQWDDNGGSNQAWALNAVQLTVSMPPTTSTPPTAPGSLTPPAAPVPINTIPTTPSCTVMTFTAGPNPIFTNGPYGITTINANATCAYEIRIGSPNGALFATGNGYSSTLTGNWVNDGMQFYLQQSGNTTAEGTLTSPITVHLKAGQAGLACLATAFTASPNPIITNDQYGQTTITAVTNCSFDIRIGSPSGPEFKEGRGYAALQTGKWVTNGMTMYLQPHGDTNDSDTLAVLKLVVQPSPAGCAVNGFSSPNNPIATTTRLNQITITADATCAYDVRVGSPSATLLGSGSGATSFLTGPWVTNGMSFFLQQSGNTTSTGTLATFTVNTKLPDQSLSTCAVRHFEASGSPLTSPAAGQTTINVNASCAWDIRLNDSAGTLVTSGTGSGSAVLTGVTTDTKVYLQPHNDTYYADTLSVLGFEGASSASSGCSALVFHATAIQSDSSFGVSEITADANCPYDVRIDAPNGPLFVSGQGFTSTSTGNWVLFGQQFFLQKQGDSTSAGTLASQSAIVLP